MKKNESLAGKPDKKARTNEAIYSFEKGLIKSLLEKYKPCNRLMVLENSHNELENKIAA